MNFVTNLNSFFLLTKRRRCIYFSYFLDFVATFANYRSALTTGHDETQRDWWDWRGIARYFQILNDFNAQKWVFQLLLLLNWQWESSIDKHNYFFKFFTNHGKCLVGVVDQAIYCHDSFGCRSVRYSYFCSTLLANRFDIVTFLNNAKQNKIINTLWFNMNKKKNIFKSPFRLCFPLPVWHKKI